VLRGFRRGLAPLAAAFAILALPASPVASQQLVTVHVGAAPVDDATPVLYAIHAGLFKKVGLDVDINALSSGSAVAAAVAGGSMQFGNSSMPALISAHAHNVPFELVAADGIYTTQKPYALMLVRKDSPIKSARDLDGKTVSSPSLKDLIWTTQMAWIDKNGGDSKTIRAVEIPNSAVVTAIEEGRIDASTVLQPRLSQALESGKVRVLGKSFDGIGTRFLISAWFTSGSYAAAHPDVVEKFTKVVEEASAYCNTHQAETIPLLAAYGKVDPKVLEKSTREEFATTLRAADIQPQIDAAAKYGVIAKRFEAQEMMGRAKR
jgi:NitT/TauT family transport system substrate-binding protein